MRVVAVLGLSGVGKSTLVNAIAKEVAISHLQASELIKQVLARRNSHLTSEELRQGPVLTNQELLVQEFRAQVAVLNGVIVFDGHSAIDTPTGLLEISSEVFDQLGISTIVFLSEDAAKIRERRVLDTRRKRPDRTEAELREHQDRAIAAAKRIAADLGIPITITSSGNHSVVRNAIFSGSITD